MFYLWWNSQIAKSQCIWNGKVEWEFCPHSYHKPPLYFFNFNCELCLKLISHTDSHSFSHSQAEQLKLCSHGWNGRDCAYHNYWLGSSCPIESSLMAKSSILVSEPQNCLPVDFSVSTAFCQTLAESFSSCHCPTKLRLVKNPADNSCMYSLSAVTAWTFFRGITNILVASLASPPPCCLFVTVPNFFN